MLNPDLLSLKLQIICPTKTYDKQNLNLLVLDSGQCVGDKLLLGQLLFPNIFKLNKNRVFNFSTLTKIQLQKVESKRCIK